jgi:hypothetical protein
MMLIYSNHASRTSFARTFAHFFSSSARRVAAFFSSLLALAEAACVSLRATSLSCVISWSYLLDLDIVEN